MGEVTGTVQKVNKAWKWFHGIPVSKGGPGSGHHGHTGGAGGKGSPGGSRSGAGFGGSVGFSDSIGGATGRALYGGDIAINRQHYMALNDDGRRFVIAHEMAHHTVEDYVLTNQEQWDRAEDALTVQLLQDGRRLFVGGNTVIGEAIADGVAATLLKSRFGNISDKRWSKVTKWGNAVIRRAGYSTPQLRRDIERWRSLLDNQL